MIPWNFGLEYFDIDKFEKEKSWCKIFVQEKIGSQKTSSKRFWDRELGDKISRHKNSKISTQNSKKQKNLKTKIRAHEN